MPEIIPFRGVRYRIDRVSGQDVVAPPYDIIPPEMREDLYRRSPYNIVRIDFGKDLPGDGDHDNRYLRARGFLDEWLKQGIFIADPSDCLYGYEISYHCRGESLRLRGVVALVRIEELGTTVFPHEETHSKPKADRLDLIRACRANISPIYSIYNSPKRILSRVFEGLHTEPAIEARDGDGARHRLFPISDPSLIAEIARDLRDRDIFIADGHHRYEVSLEYKKQMDAIEGQGAHPRPAPRPWDYVMMFLANIADEGVTILPTHRLVKRIGDDTDILGRLRPDFSIKPINGSASLGELLGGAGRNSFGLYDGRDGSFHLLQYKGNELRDIPEALRRLDVVILHELIFRRDLGIDDISYEMNMEEAVRKVKAGLYDAAFFLNPTTVQDIERVAVDRLRMPPKSTYFYPKLLTGMVINSFKYFQGGSHGS